MSSISKQDGRLQGHAGDPIFGPGLDMEAICLVMIILAAPQGMPCFLAGGSASAALLHLIDQAAASQRPSRVILVDKFARAIESHSRDGRAGGWVNGRIQNIRRLKYSQVQIITGCAVSAVCNLIHIKMIF